MLLTGLAVFDATIQNSNTWFDEMMRELGWQDKYRGYLALRITLHTLRDMLQAREVAALGNALPMLIRGLYFEGWTAVEKPRKRGRSDFLKTISEYFNSDPVVHPEIVARAVLHMIIRSMTETEVKDINELLPVELQDLWTEQKVK